jgi:hypothetical protein
MKAVKHSSVQQLDKTLNAQNSVPNSMLSVPAMAGPKQTSQYELPLANFGPI